MIANRRRIQPLKVKNKKKHGSDSRAMSECLECRLLLYSYLTVGTTGTLPLQVVSGSSVNVTADVQQHDNVDTIQANPAGTVTFLWYSTPGGTSGVLGTTSNFTVITPKLDSQVTATLNLTRPFGNGDPDTFGDFLIVAYYSGDGNFPAINSYASQNTVQNSRVDPENRYIPVDFVSAKSSIAVTRQPGNTAMGDRINPSVQVSILNAAGSVNTTSTAAITVALASTSTGIGTLSGTKTVAAIGGVASFADLSIDKAGQYSLTFTDAAGDTTPSGLFNVTGGKLVFIRPPHDGSAGEALNPAVKIALEDRTGAIITSDSSSVVTLTPIATRPNPQFSGNTVALVNGVATFSNLILRNPDFYKLQADDGGDTQAVSSRFKITGTHLVVRAQPGNADARAPIALSVGIYTAANRLDTLAEGAIQVSLNTLTPGLTARLGGIVNANFVNGVATFTPPAGPTIDTPGRYSFTLTEVQDNSAIPLLGTSTPITSRPFNIAGFHLVFTAGPAPSDVDHPLLFSVAAENGRHQIDTNLNSDHLQLTLTPTRNGVGAELSAYTNPGFVGGVETFSAGQSPSVNTPGTYSLTATEVDSTGAIVATTAPATFRNLKVTGYHLVFDIQPTTASINRPIPLAIEIQDVHGNVQTGFDGDTIQLRTSPAATSGYSAIPFTNGRVDFAATRTDSLGVGVASFIMDADPGTYTITATALNAGAAVREIEPVTTRRFRLGTQHLVFVEQPANTSTNQPVAFAVAIEDAQGHIDTDENLAKIKLSTEPAGVLGYTSQTFSSGKVVYSDSLLNAFRLHNSLVQIDGLGRYKLIAMALHADGSVIPGITSGTSHLFRILPLHLVFITQPQSIGVGFPVPAFTVGLANASGTLISDPQYIISVDAEFRPVHRGGPSGDLGASTSVDTVAHFNLLHINTPGTYTIVATVLDATAGNILPAVSQPIIISP